MSPFDIADPERRPPSAPTPRCELCAEAALTRYSGYCFRHMTAPISSGAARSAIRSLSL